MRLYPTYDKCNANVRAFSAVHETNGRGDENIRTNSNVTIFHTLHMSNIIS